MSYIRCTSSSKSLHRSCWASEALEKEADVEDEVVYKNMDGTKLKLKYL